VACRHSAGLAADIDDFSICQHGRRAIGDIGDGYTTADHATVSSACAAAANHSFIDPHSADSKCPNVSQHNRLTGDDLGDGFAHQGKHLSAPAVKQRRLVPDNQKMTEREPCRRGNIRHEDRNAIDAGAIDAGLHAS
jgi:hypothetical protein